MARMENITKPQSLATSRPFSGKPIDSTRANQGTDQGIKQIRNGSIDVKTQLDEYFTHGRGTASWDTLKL
ncbi:hypothetical protein EC957_000877 [Mortierella hygrophila]|uniref:Uncharacterized protein n=1 Tax=Mortierella hygrophila TaxID=979708 RepID=A0A9P6K307_9FUNG|nr:hypothetical protein EC957_000877 [Mortierella hygrophila]